MTTRSNELKLLPRNPLHAEQFRIENNPVDFDKDNVCFGGYSRLHNPSIYVAAPDMLAVLKDLEESAEYWGEYDVPINIVNRIKAAIAKAEAIWPSHVNAEVGK